VGNVNAQLPNDGKLRYDPAPFLGKWEAQHRDQTYELAIMKVQLYFEQMGLYFETLQGEMTYKTNGVVTRHVKINGQNAIFNGRPASPTEINFRYHDEERKVGGNGKMTLSAQDPTRATWKLTKGGPSYEWPQILGPGWMDADLDVPLELEWTKIE
jgi:hypothetical protein